MSLELNEIQKSIRAKLITNSNLLSILAAGANSIVDNSINLNLSYPFITFISSNVEPDDTVSNNGHIVFVQLGAYTQTGSKQQAQSILKEINLSLHNQKLTVTNLDYCYCRCEFSEIIIDDEATSNGYNGIIRLRLTTY